MIKAYFIIFLLIVAVSFFSARIIFEKKRGFFRFAGLEVFVLGVMFSFVFPQENLLENLYPFIALAISFAGFSFGIQFERRVLKSISTKYIFYGFITSLNFFVLLFVLHFFYPFPTAIFLSAIFSIPSSSILFSVRENKILVVSGELSIALVLVYYGITMYGFRGLLISIALSSVGFLIVLFERILKKVELYVLVFGLLLFVASLSQLFNTSIILSSLFTGFIVAIFPTQNYSSAVMNKVEQPLFLSLLFSSGLFFSFNGFLGLLIFFIAYPFIRFSFVFPLFKKKGIFLIPIGALSIALSIEIKTPLYIMFTAVSYFVLLALFEFMREKWAT